MNIRYLVDTYRRQECGFMLLFWFVLNIAITLYSKLAFVTYKFPYPLMMTTVHLIFTWMGVQASQHLRLFTPCPSPDSSRLRKVFYFSFLFSVNIWLSNASLLAVSVTVNQVMRTTVPLFTLAIGILAFGERYSWEILLPILVVILGVVFTIHGDVEVSPVGFVLVILACASSSLKGIISKRAQMGESMTALDLLNYMCPFAVVELLVFSVLTGEMMKMISDENLRGNVTILCHLVVLGCIAFLVNFTSFRAVFLSSPLTMNVLANLKQVLTSLLSIPLIGGALTPSLGVGIFVTAVGAYWYSRVQSRCTRKVETSTESPKQGAKENNVNLKNSQVQIPVVGLESADASQKV